MIVIPGLLQPLKAAGKRITSWVEESDAVMVEVGSTVRRAACPRCPMRSSRLHGHDRRAIADSPCFGRPVTLAVEIRRFKCTNDCCAQRTFCECIEPLAVARQRRTLRLMPGEGVHRRLATRSVAKRALGWGGNWACGSADPRCCVSCAAPAACPHRIPWSSALTTGRSPAVTAMARSWWTWTDTVRSNCWPGGMHQRWSPG